MITKFCGEESGGHLIKYYNDICQYPLLNIKEERSLFAMMQKWSKNKTRAGEQTRKNGNNAREKLINSNLRFVVKICKDFPGFRAFLPELISEGNVGLIHAVNRYKLNKGSKFSTYAVYWIRQRIFRFLDDKVKLIRVPSGTNQTCLRISRWMDDQKDSTGKTPSIKEVSKKFKIKVSFVASALEASKEVKSLDSKSEHEDGEGLSLGEKLENVNDILPNKSAEISNNKKILSSLLNRLTRREKLIVSRRFGLNDNDFNTLQELGTRYKVSRERIRQVEEKALKKLRVLIYKKYRINLDDQREKLFSFKF